MESWLDAPLDGSSTIDDLARRYLGAFGPATVMDMQAWCGLTRLAEVFERLRSELRVDRNEAGREVFDLPDAPRPDADVPAPPRFLPSYDNVTLGHADRTRIVSEELRRRIAATAWMRPIAGFLVDGTAAGTWEIVREGDGATPIASMRLLNGFFRGDRMRDLRTPLPMRRIRPDMLWCDEPRDPNYNRLVRRPLKVSHEEMRRKDGLYDACLVLDWNITSRRRNRGSAIFFHLIRPGFEPTAGCVAIRPADMRRLLPLIGRRTMLKVV